MDDKSDYSFDVLFAAVDRHLRMKREDAMQEALSRGLMGVSDRAATGPEPKTGRAKHGDKPKKRPSSAPPGGGKASSGNSKDTTGPCHAFQTGTCTRGQDCGKAPVNGTSDPGH